MGCGQLVYTTLPSARGVNRLLRRTAAVFCSTLFLQKWWCIFEPECIFACMCGCTCVCHLPPPPTFCDRTRLLGLPAALTPHLKAPRSLTQHSQWCLQPPCGNVGNYVTHLLAATWTADVYMAYRFPVILSPQSGNDSEDLYQQPTEEIKLLIQTRAYTYSICTWKILM